MLKYKDWHHLKDTSAAATSRQNELIEAYLRTLGKGDRARDLEYLWAQYWGIQYDLDWSGRQLFEWRENRYSDGTGIPTYMRKPLVRANYDKTLVDRVHAMLLGEGQMPTLTVVGPDGKPLEEATTNLTRLREGMKWDSLWRTCGLAGLVQGSAVPGFSVLQRTSGPSRGQYRLYRQPIMAHQAYPKFGYDNPELADLYDIPDDDLVGLTVVKVYVEFDAEGKPRWKVWKRVMTPTTTTTFQVVDVTDLGVGDRIPEVPDGDPVKHDLGFVPAVWVRTLEVPGEVDGVSVLEGMESMLEAIDRTISARCNASEYHGDPTLAPKDNESAKVFNEKGTVGKGAAKMLPAPAVMVEMDGQGQVRQAELIRDLMKAAQDHSGIRIHDQESAKGALSSLALKQLMQPTVDLVSKLRAPFGEGEELLASKVLRAAQQYGLVKNIDLPEGWMVKASYGPVVKPNEADAQQVGEAVGNLYKAGLLSRRTAISAVARYYGISDVDAEVTALDAESNKPTTV